MKTNGTKSKQTQKLEPSPATRSANAHKFLFFHKGKLRAHMAVTIPSNGGTRMFTLCLSKPKRQTLRLREFQIWWRQLQDELAEASGNPVRLTMQAHK